MEFGLGSGIWEFFCRICKGLFGFFFDCLAILGFWGHPDIGTAITKCFEHLDDEKHILDPGHLHP